MRSRTAGLSLVVLALAVGAIAVAPAAKASQQTVISQEVPIAGGHASFPLDSLSYLDITVPEAAVVRIVRADSAGHHLLVVLVKSLPNPAGQRTAMSTRAYRSSSQLAFTDNRSAGYFAERSSLLPFQSSHATADHASNQRLTSGLRGAALIGTLVRGRLTRL